MSATILPPNRVFFLPKQSPSRWRKFSFALHQLQNAIAPHLSLMGTLIKWHAIARTLAEPPRTR